MEEIEQAVQVFNQGGIVIFPTDTAYGIGCRMDNEKAVQRLFTLRKRPLTQATPVLISSIEMAQKYLLPIPKDVKEQLLDIYWPGALTIIFNCIKMKVPELVRGGGDSLGVRIPNHQTILAIIKRIGVPILGPSANFHGEKTPYSFEDIDKELVKQIDYVIEDTCDMKKVSTLIDCTVSPWKILREGAVKSLVKSI
jgi:L-threonylcarbamoyladenylate synthase